MSRPGRGGRAREGGYAVIAAMVCAAGVALAAGQLTATSRDAVLSASAEAVRARMTAEAEAGFALALAGLEAPTAAARWTLDGEARTLDFDGAELSVDVEDEQGKIPLNSITPQQAAAMFRLAGAEPAALAPLVQAFLLLRDPSWRPLGEDDGAATPPVTTPVPVPASAAAPHPAEAGPPGLASVRDLLLLPGMTAPMYAALAPAVSVSVRDARFEPRTAPPLALAVMGGADGAPGRPALDTAAPLALAGRPLTVRVRVRDTRGDRYQRAWVVELTRAPARPYVVRLITADGA